MMKTQGNDESALIGFNKARYTATKFACGWALTVVKKANPSCNAETTLISKKNDGDRQTDKQMDGWTNQQAGFGVPCN